MDPREQPQDTMNMTRALEALSPYLNHPRKIVNRIEAFVAVAAAMLFLQLILGPWRRRSGHWFVQGPLWLVYRLSFPLITYTLGQMVSSPVKSALYPVWALILFWASGCTNGITAYSLEDNKEWKHYLFELLQYSVFVGVILALVVPSGQMMIYGVPYLIFIAMLVFASNLIRVIAGWMVTNSTPSKLLADYMRDQVGARVAQEPSDPSTMEGYRYLVQPSLQYKFSKGQEDTDEDSGITIKQIWDIDDRLLNTQLKHVCLSFALSHLLQRRFFEMDCAEAGLAKTHKFALKVLLSKENQGNHYSKPFHIIEVELGFLYDFFFTKYAALFAMEEWFFHTVPIKLFYTYMFGVALFISVKNLSTPDSTIEVDTRGVDVNVTMVIIVALLLSEALQAILYLTSDWATVSLACSYTRRGTRGCRTSYKFCKFLVGKILKLNLSFYKFCKFLVPSSSKVFGKILKLNLSGYWQNEMGQSSVIEGCLHVNVLNVIPMHLNFPLVNCREAIPIPFIYIYRLIHSIIFPMKKFEEVPDLVKNETVACLQNSKLPLTNGAAALDRNSVFEEFSWTLENHSQTTVMLIWHIATEYCNIASSDETEELQRGSPEEKLQKDYQQVANTLSKYCAYLMSFLPELLPGNSTDTRFLLHLVLLEGSSKLRKGKLSRYELLKELLEGMMLKMLCKGKLSKDGLLKIINDSESSSSSSNEDQTIVHYSVGYDNNDTTVHAPSSNEDNIINDPTGSNNDHTNAQDSTTNNNENIFIKGLNLGRELENKDVVLRWKVLAEFWVETIIYIAPSDKVKAHMERLAQGGEFLTHVWALLTHAGILKRDQNQTPEDIV